MCAGGYRLSGADFDNSYVRCGSSAAGQERPFPSDRFSEPFHRYHATYPAFSADSFVPGRASTQLENCDCCQRHTAYARVNAMKALTHWFNAKLHSPAREGWYDCKECKTRHYFKDGLWYRDKKSLRDGPMTIQKMHWRGLAKREGLASLLTRCDPDAPRSAEEQAWENMAPVGMEFGSPDFERLMHASIDDLKAGKVNL